MTSSATRNTSTTKIKVLPSRNEAGGWFVKGWTLPDYEPNEAANDGIYTEHPALACGKHCPCWPRILYHRKPSGACYHTSGIDEEAAQFQTQMQAGVWRLNRGRAFATKAKAKSLQTHQVDPNRRKRPN